MYEYWKNLTNYLHEALLWAGAYKNHKKVATT